MTSLSKGYMYQIPVLALASILLVACTYPTNFRIFNNTDYDIEICNLNITQEEECIIIGADEHGTYRLYGDMPSDSWKMHVKEGERLLEYEFVFDNPDFEYVSEIYCSGLFGMVCDIAVQYDSNAFYWVGRNNSLPVSVFPEQPDPFPITPSQGF
ncbi:hypothetical protein E4656_20020 [Natronospirillum operosum]|uniref:Uncharacterized protein n=1 Tax=Natronospirillum operosum TaxID=2759953 RepID=A0A4Z0VZA7_9GAMM|nr:hypothetical protein [Natronospirillum operosum]TGG89388.1 hypothetical protein E4656_20020 [Natronospirillum operosum]